MHRLVPTAPAGHDAGLALYRRIGADHIYRLQANSENIRMRQGEPIQKLPPRIARMLISVFIRLLRWRA